MSKQVAQEPAAGAAPRVKEGGLAPKTGARLVRINDSEVPALLREILSRGGIIVGFTYESLPIVQMYDRQQQRYRRFTWRLVDSTRVGMFEVVE